MFRLVKNLCREMLPQKYQVPAQYWYGWLRGGLEEEMRLLGLLFRPSTPSTPEALRVVGAPHFVWGDLVAID